jgi:hypothetical protein
MNKCTAFSSACHEVRATLATPFHNRNNDDAAVSVYWLFLRCCSMQHLADEIFDPPKPFFFFFCPVFDWYMPKEVQRKLTGLCTIKSYKMRQYRNIVVYLLFMTLRVVYQEIDERNEADMFGSFLKRESERLCRAIRLVAGFSVIPVPTAKAKEAQKLLEKFLLECAQRDGRFNSFTAHNAVHLVQDMTTFLCHLDRNSAYPFESFHQEYTGLIKPGPNPVTQLR